MLGFCHSWCVNMLQKYEAIITLIYYNAYHFMRNFHFGYFVVISCYCSLHVPSGTSIGTIHIQF